MAFYSEAKKVPGTDDAPSRRSAPARALVVDDDHCLVQVVHQMLEVLGFRADSAIGGLAAMRCLSQSRYDLMITDLQMPDMDGYTLSGWLKHKSPDTKVIVMTGNNHADVVNYMDTGIVDHWLFKPFSLTKLAGILNELVPTDMLRRFVGTRINAGRPESGMTMAAPAGRNLHC
jgi:DNA-binding NtrC family response regulator